MLHQTRLTDMIILVMLHSFGWLGQYNLLLHLRDALDTLTLAIFLGFHFSDTINSTVCQYVPLLQYGEKGF